MFEERIDPVGSHRRPSVDDGIEKLDQLPSGDVPGFLLADLVEQVRLQERFGYLRSLTGANVGLLIGFDFPYPCARFVVPALGLELSVDELLNDIGDGAGGGPLDALLLDGAFTLGLLIDGV